MTLDEKLAAGAEFTVTVEYSASPELYRPAGAPFPMGWDVSPNRQLLVHGFPGAAATWTPTNEVKDDTARYIYRIDTPEGFVATASGRGPFV